MVNKALRANLNVEAYPGPHKHLRWETLQQYLTAFIRLLFLNSFPSSMSAGVLATPQYYFISAQIVSRTVF